MSRTDLMIDDGAKQAHRDATHVRTVGIMDLRRSLVLLCSQVALHTSMTNGEKLDVLAHISNTTHDTPATFGKQSDAITADTFEDARAHLAALAEFPKFSREGKRFLLLASDSYQDASRAFR